jgi:phage terminase large subunit
MAAAVSLRPHPVLELVHGIKQEEESTEGLITWPSTRYAEDPAAFCIEVLGFAPTRRQLDVFEAVRAHQRVAIPAGRKVGKSRLLAALALWHFSLYEDATVVIVAPCERQIVEITWHDLVALFHASGVCLRCKLLDPDGPRPCAHSACIDGTLAASVRTGLRAGQRRIIGLAPKNSDNARGISGPNQLWLIDESSGVSKEIYEAADGNRAGGAKIVVAGNPTSRSGWFFDSCETFRCIRISSLESPNVVFGRRVVPGMAEAQWIEEKRADWGEDDPRYQVEILGIAPTRDGERLCTDEQYSACVARHECGTDKAATGTLYFGIDPASGSGGDKSTIVARRGSRILTLRRFDGGTDVIMVELDGLLKQHREWAGEEVVINFDASSTWGSDLAAALRSLKLRDDAIIFHGLEMRGAPGADPLMRGSGCARLVDIYWRNLELAIRSDLAVPYDEELRAELIFAEWREDQEGGAKLISKREYRKKLGRSPDISDALAFSLWEGRILPASRAAAQYREELTVEAPQETRSSAGAIVPDGAGDVLDVYGAVGNIDPYASDVYGNRRR